MFFLLTCFAVFFRAQERSLTSRSQATRECLIRRDFVSRRLPAHFAQRSAPFPACSGSSAGVGEFSFVSLLFGPKILCGPAVARQLLLGVGSRRQGDDRCAG